MEFKMNTKRIPRNNLVLSVCFCIGLTACDTSAIKENTKEISTVIGGAVGGVIGSKIGKGNGRTAAIIGGTLLGAYLGSELGKYLEEQDQKAHLKTTKKALSTGKTQSWTNPDTKTSGKSRIVSTKTKKEPVKVAVLKKKIKKVPPLEIIGETYSAKKKSNLRGGPGTDYEIVGGLPKGENVNVVGKVKEKDWYLVSYDGVGTGFVYSPLLISAPTEIPSSSGTTIAKEDISEQEVATNRKCRTVEQSVSLADGSSHQETIQACQGPNGWEVQT